jgi:hypothetical protein
MGEYKQQPLTACVWANTRPVQKQAKSLRALIINPKFGGKLAGHVLKPGLQEVYVCYLLVTVSSFIIYYNEPFRALCSNTKEFLQNLNRNPKSYPSLQQLLWKETYWQSNNWINVAGIQRCNIWVHNSRRFSG